MKGKKYNAAEKHFNKFKADLYKEVKEAKETAINAEELRKHAYERLSLCTSENESLKEQNAKLLELVGMTEDELKNHIKATDGVSNLASVCKMLRGRSII